MFFLKSIGIRSIICESDSCSWNSLVVLTVSLFLICDLNFGLIFVGSRVWHGVRLEQAAGQSERSQGGPRDPASRVQEGPEDSRRRTKHQRDGERGGDDGRGARGPLRQRVLRHDRHRRPTRRQDVQHVWRAASVSNPFHLHPTKPRAGQLSRDDRRREAAKPEAHLLQNERCQPRGDRQVQEQAGGQAVGVSDDLEEVAPAVDFLGRAFAALWRFSVRGCPAEAQACSGGHQVAAEAGWSGQRKVIINQTPSCPTKTHGL